MMKRDAALEILARHYADGIVVPVYQSAFDWMAIRPHPLNYLCTGAMGQAVSHALGLALGCPEEKVVVLDGDGSVLMNLGGLATLARYRPKNLLHVIFDNGSLLSTGGFETHTTHGVTDLAHVARGAGIEHVDDVDSVMAFGEAAVAALERDDLSVIVARVKAVGPDNYGMDLALPENAFRFKRCVQERKA